MPRGLLIFVLCLPLAILMGYMLADPLMGTNMMVVAGVMVSLLIPLALAVHHRVLIWVAWASMNAFFIKGAPAMWMVFAGLSFTIAILSRPLTKVKMKPVWERTVLASIILVLCSVTLTAFHAGGIGMRVLGSSMYGGRKYIALLASGIGFLALTLSVIRRRNAQRDVSIFTLGPVTAAVSNVAYMLGPAFYFLFALFPVDQALGQAQADLAPGLGGIKRINGFGPASTAICMFCLLRWGVRGMCDPSKPWRMGLLIIAQFGGMLSGFRSALIVNAVIAFVQFFAEGLHRTRFAAAFLGLILTGLTFLAIFSEQLPLSAQRAISFLPVRVDPVAAADASTSLRWRIDMWQFVIKQIPNHLWLGKGYAIDPTDLYLAEESFKRGYLNDFEISSSASDFHSGILSILVPFGLVGLATTLFFFTAATRVVYRNMRYGDAEIRNINIFLFSLFVGRMIYFFLMFGAIEGDFWLFVSVVGVSLALNGGMKGPPAKAKFDLMGKRGRSPEKLELAAEPHLA